MYPGNHFFEGIPEIYAPIRIYTQIYIYIYIYTYVPTSSPLVVLCLFVAFEPPGRLFDAPAG
jgi:hypothetical protein